MATIATLAASTEQQDNMGRRRPRPHLLRLPIPLAPPRRRPNPRQLLRTSIPPRLSPAAQHLPNKHSAPNRRPQAHGDDRYSDGSVREAAADVGVVDVVKFVDPVVVAAS
ncbi:hypothetical protein FGG08_001312 [Glutinoglossum americanum]|uniref:Uncharacterized protein n=1 Tax=Glutinoglossum americanum TaxID=1670608 RepID=A0A9P8IBB5_9PEZI|nr:hypothetical protein FGG08_001312 [Glutinoglossum americanum]